VCCAAVIRLAHDMVSVKDLLSGVIDPASDGLRCSPRGAQPIVTVPDEQHVQYNAEGKSSASCPGQSEGRAPIVD